MCLYMRWLAPRFPRNRHISASKQPPLRFTSNTKSTGIRSNNGRYRVVHIDHDGSRFEPALPYRYPAVHPTYRGCIAIFRARSWLVSEARFGCLVSHQLRIVGRRRLRPPFGGARSPANGSFQVEPGSETCDTTYGETQSGTANECISAYMPSRAAQTTV